MPNRRRPIDPSTPLGGFAIELLEMKRKAFARAGTPQEAAEISVDRIAAASADSPWRTSRTAIYAALSGTRLVSEDALCVMVTAWEEDSPAARAAWLTRRGKVEEAIIAAKFAETPRDAARTPAPSQSMTRNDTLRWTAKPDKSTYVPSAAQLRLKGELRDASRRARLTIAELAARTGLSRTTVSVALNAHNPNTPSVQTVYALGSVLKACGVPIDVRHLMDLGHIARAERAGFGGAGHSGPPQ